MPPKFSFGGIMSRPVTQVSPYEVRLDATARPKRKRGRPKKIFTRPPQGFGDRASGADIPDPDTLRRHYLTAQDIWRRYSIRETTLWRWSVDRELKFPPPTLRIRDRRYWLEETLVQWEQSLPPSGDAGASKESEPVT
jgi:hypothetical protein